MKVKLAAVILAGLPTFASSAVMTFEGIGSDPLSNTYSEDGITAVSGGLAEFVTPEAAHLDDSGTIYSNGIEFTMGERFDAISFDLRSAGFNNELLFDDGANADFFYDVTFDNVLVQGIRSSTVVAEYIFDMGPFSRTFATYQLSEFTNLDALFVGFSPTPTADDFSPPSGSIAYFRCDAPCSHYDLDNVKLTTSSQTAPIPLPASLPLLLAGLGGLGWIARRKLQQP